MRWSWQVVTLLRPASQPEDPTVTTRVRSALISELPPCRSAQSSLPLNRSPFGVRFERASQACMDACHYSDSHAS
eukprot:jgi/Mesvir1/19291/Mv25204-RA.1